VLYASAQPIGCYLETLARFRLDPTLYAELSQIEGENDFFPLGQVPPAWSATRSLGRAEHQGNYADLYASEWIGLLRRELAVHFVRLGIVEFDASTLQHSTPRALTHQVSRFVFQRGFDGIYYHSKYGHDIVNWALFEPFKLTRQSAGPIDLTDAELQRALAIHHLQIGS
jgi:RES domain